MTEYRQVQALLRLDLASFINKSFLELAPGEPYLPNWHIEAIAEKLMACERGDIRRLIITIPPRYLKSVAASVAFPAWVLGRRPHRKLICASYSQELANKLSIDCRSIMEADWYRKLFPGLRTPTKQKQHLLRTSEGGMRLATSVTGTMRGLGGDMIIIDDPLKGLELLSKTERAQVAHWYDAVVRSRLNNKNEGVIILIMQRIHEDDLVGHVLKHEDWVHLNIPAIAVERQTYDIRSGRTFLRQIDDVIQPDRESREALEQVRRSLGTYNFMAQYQQNPIPLEGNFFKRTWFKYYTPANRPSKFDRVVQSWDTAVKVAETNDYSVCTSWGVVGSDYYLLDVMRERLEYPDLKRRAIALANAFSPTAILIEDTSAGSSLVQDLRRETRLRPIAVSVAHNDKEVRAAAQSAKVEAGQVFLPEQAPWLDVFRGEMAAFPGGAHDDQVDSMTQFLRWVSARPGPRLERPNPKRPSGLPPKARPLGPKLS